MRYVGGRVDLTDPEDVAAFVAEVLVPGGYALLIVDTVARNIGGARENEDLAKVVGACEQIHEAAGTTVLLVHHSGWEGTHSRGPSALPFASDAAWQFSAPRPDGTVKVTCDRMKDRDPR